MFSAIFPILVNIFLLSRVETIPIINENNCSTSKLVCICQNTEVFTSKTIEACCKNPFVSLVITGLEVKNISIDLRGSPCSKKIEVLSIRDTGIVSFHSAFYGLDNVTKVYIEKNQNLTYLNKLYFSEINPNIDTITVESNAVRSISSKTFFNLPNLTSLKLSENKIGFIEDQSFTSLLKLSTLHINSNILTVLTAEMFYGLENLKTMSLLNNHLIELKSDVFKYVPNLQYLTLSISPISDFSGFSHLPDNVFFPIKKLKSLGMLLKIKNLTTLTFYGLYELEKLELQGNKITVIPSGALQQVPKVTSINLSNNTLRCLLPETFRSLPRLLTLDLSHNELSFISNEVFADLNQLQLLDLTENNIFVIERNAFVGLKSLVAFKINIIHGKAKNELIFNYNTSPVAKLRNLTKIIGLSEVYGIYKGTGEPPEVYAIGQSKNQDMESKKNYCPVAGVSDKDWADSSRAGSHKYLLIIVGICVVFLLISFAIIMSYRAWSKRKMSELSYNVAFDEKQEMIVNNTNSVNGRIDGKSHSKSNQTRKSLNGSYMPDSPVEITETKTDSLASNQAQQSNLQPSTKPNTCPLSNECNQSDDESALTPLGVL